MQKIKQRVMALADALNVGHKQFAENLGMTYSNFTGRAGETPLNSNAVAKILTENPHVNARWLMTGEGEMFENGVVAYPVSEKKSRKAKDFQGTYEIVTPSAQRDVPQWLIEEHRLHGETVLSQQRTIEKLVGRLKD
jgi:hypothetical protein